MITDALLTVSGANNPNAPITGQAVTAQAVSTDTIDLQVARDIGEGTDLYMVFTVVDAFTHGGSMTGLTFEIITSASANLGTPTVRSSVTIPVASLTAKAQFVLPVPPLFGSTGQRYLGARYSPVGANATGGSVLTQIVLDLQDGKTFYARGDQP